MTASRLTADPVHTRHTAAAILRAVIAGLTAADVPVTLETVTAVADAMERPA